MTGYGRGINSFRVLILAPTQKDAEITGKILGDDKLSYYICSNIQSFCVALSQGAGVGIITEEALKEDSKNLLLQALKQQAPWSDFPLLVLTPTGELSLNARERLKALGHVTLLRRPVQIAEMLSAVRSALRDRKRQYEVHHYLDEREQHMRELERINNELKDITHIASHDLKEPLRGLIMKSTFLLEDYRDKLDDVAVKQLKGLTQLSQRSYQLINDLLNISRIGSLKPNTEELDPNKIVRDIELTLEGQLKERKARITVPAPLPKIKCDKNIFSQVLRNLITNGLIYNVSANPTVEVGFLREMTVNNKIEENVFYVKDNGIGIPPEFHTDVFRLFKRLETSKEYNPAGTGAGLTLIKKMIERCNGRIWFTSATDEGSTFYFTLPDTR